MKDKKNKFAGAVITVALLFMIGLSTAVLVWVQKREKNLSDCMKAWNLGIKDQVEISEKNFPDDIFRAYVAVEFDKNGDGILSADEIMKVNEICLTDPEVKSLQGMEYFPLLKSLICAKTSITALDVSHNPKLERLYCEGTKLVGLDVTHNPKLMYLACWNVPLTWLHTGYHENLTVVKSFRIQDLGTVGESFSITEQFPGIDVSKMRIVSGARMDHTGRVQDYREGVPIVYAYDCGNVNWYYDYYGMNLGIIPEPQHGAMTMLVTLLFKMK